MNQEKLKNRKAVITGGSGGIGKAVAQKFLENGAEVLLVARGESELESSGAELSKFGKTHTIVADVSSEADAKKVSHKAENLWSEVDILVNAAGIYGPIGSLLKVDPAEWKKTIDVNLIGSFLMIKNILAILNKNGLGRIINFVGGGEGAYPNFTAYVSSKGGIARLSETVAAELEKQKIGVNAVAPGPVNTQLLEELLAAGPDKTGQENYKKALKQKEAGGVGTEPIAGLCLFLASDESRGLSGKVLSAVWDDVEKLKAHLSEISSSDVYTYRRIRPEDRGLSW